MSQISLLTLLLWNGILVEPYRVAQAEPGHHQVSLQAAMANDGRFAIAWVDSLQLVDHFDLDIYIRFFDKDGNPMTPACRLPKLYDTAWVNWPSLDMDSVGNTVLVWVEGRTASSEILSKVRFQRFTPEGTFVSLPKTIWSDVNLGYPVTVSLANTGELAIASQTEFDEIVSAWVQRFNLDGLALDSVFMAQDTSGAMCPEVALNDDGKILVTWLEYGPPPNTYPRFQVFDKDDKAMLPWEPHGHRLDNGDTSAGASRPEPHWIDNDRFVVFWTDSWHPPYVPIPLLGRVINQDGAVKHPIRIILLDSLFKNSQDDVGRFKTAVLPDGSFATTHTRCYTFMPDTTNPYDNYTWEHAGGIFGQVVNNEPLRRTTLFEVSAPFGSDTLFTNWDYVRHFNSPPAVAACNDRLIWVYPRFNPDTVFEAWAVITDWDMGENIAENPLITQPDFEIANPIGREIVLRYSDCPQGFSASIFDVSGRRVDELYAPTQSGTLAWGNNKPSGVYFIVPQGLTNPMKVILAR